MASAAFRPRKQDAIAQLLYKGVYHMGFTEGAACSYTLDNGQVVEAEIINPHEVWQCDVKLPGGSVVHNADTRRISYRVPSVVVPVRSIPDLSGTNGKPISEGVLQKHAQIECYYADTEQGIHWKVYQEYFPGDSPLMMLWHPTQSPDGFLTQEERAWDEQARTIHAEWQARQKEEAALVPPASKGAIPAAFSDFGNLPTDYDNFPF
jgi:hypothetical protein